MMVGRLSDLGRTLIADFTHISLGPTPAEIKARLSASDDILNAQDDPNLAAKAAMAARVGTGTCEESCVTQHHITPGIHPLYTFTAVHTPVYTRYT